MFFKRRKMQCFVIQGDKVIVTDVLYSASDVESRLKG